MTSPVIWAVCASDSRGGAGLQAALAQAALPDENGQVCQCRSIVTAVTAQSSHGVRSVQALPVSVVEAQWQAAMEDGHPDAILVGWLPPDSELIEWLVNQLRWMSAPVIWDPVIQATGAGLPQAQASLRSLIACARVITPTREEACWLTGMNYATDADLARGLQNAGAHTVLISGGDSDPMSEWVTDRVYSRVDPAEHETAVLSDFAVHQKRLSGSAHGTGSHHSAAIAVALARGERLYDALLRGSVMARAALKAGRDAGFPADHRQPYPNCIAAMPPATGDDWPLVTPLDQLPVARVRRPPPMKDNELGLYALTDNLEHLESLLALPVDAIQWRVKERDSEYRRQTLAALNLCRKAGVPFWLNDDWRLALEIFPDGVHLGQEDLCRADLDALRHAGIAFGTSNHTEWEIARSRAMTPAYLAFGPVYPPLSKTLKYPPLGTSRLAVWSRRYRSWKQTCIGGIVPGNARQTAACGTGSLAVVTCLQPGADQKNNADALISALENLRSTPISESS